MREITKENIDTAYRKFKQHVYYNKNDLFLRKTLCDFECDKSFDARLERLLVNINRKGFENSKYFEALLGRISFRTTPKSIKKEQTQKYEGTFISNISTKEKYEFDRVNYFFDGPIELHLISVLWILFDGYKLDSKLGPECCGSRLHKKLDPSDFLDGRLFKKYHKQYSGWRDSGIEKARQSLQDSNESVAIVGLDVKSFFYSAIIDFDQLEEDIAAIEIELFDKPLSDHKFLHCLQRIHEEYYRVISSLHSITHHEQSDTVGIPLGLCSSPIFANWTLAKFDQMILDNVRPIYYGRYIDDILLVVKSRVSPKSKNPIGEFLANVLVKPDVLIKINDNDFKINDNDQNLILQQEKCILQYFDAEHTIAGLDKFKKNLENNGSDILLLSIEEEGSSLSDVAYDLLYVGSVNKFRSVKGIAENRFELSKFLAKKTIDYQLSGGYLSHEDKRDILGFFKGKNAIEFCDLWEKVLSLYVISGDLKGAAKFISSMSKEIQKVYYVSGDIKANSRKMLEITRKIREYLDHTLKLGSEIAHSLLGVIELDEQESSFRIANMIRHNLIPHPLSNYSDFDGNLIHGNEIKGQTISAIKALRSPRFVNFDECMMFATNANVSSNFSKNFIKAKTYFKMFNDENVNLNVDYKVVQK